MVVQGVSRGGKASVECTDELDTPVQERRGLAEDRWVGLRTVNCIIRTESYLVRQTQQCLKRIVLLLTHGWHLITMRLSYFDTHAILCKASAYDDPG